MIRKQADNKSNLLDIEVVSYSKSGEPPRPLRFRVEIEDEVKVGKIITVKERIMEKYMGNIMYLYRCDAIVDGKPETLELKYERDTMKWFLYKPGTTQVEM